MGNYESNCSGLILVMMMSIIILLVVMCSSSLSHISVYGDSKSFTKVCKWSPNGRGLLSVEHDGMARVWRMKVHHHTIYCIHS